MPASTTAAGCDADIPTVVKKLPASVAAESAEHLVMETKLKIIEILQVSIVSAADIVQCNVILIHFKSAFCC